MYFQNENSTVNKVTLIEASIQFPASKWSYINVTVPEGEYRILLDVSGYGTLFRIDDVQMSRNLDGTCEIGKLVKLASILVLVRSYYDVISMGHPYFLLINALLRVL